MATGGCLCGAVRYRITGPLRATSLCHCESCRRATGGPSLAWAIFGEDDVEITTGTLAVYESSPGVERGFCARCGTSLSYRRANRPGLFDVTTASLDDPELFPPDKEIWVEERLSFVAPNPDLPQHARFSTPAAAPSARALDEG
ncbi:GFA family protein [Sphingosinicella sp. BN140058]|uniref:GFA family protein n=1 Tax=Sphingosinicella sp. BN140058 TaxID=1892855 RepID=UPI0010139279|nr:GFA family protein [Sphingosinicella sp. BN140058]QAY77794.1 GFA family protein [Sphingosinicella sp. BN140058]